MKTIKIFFSSHRVRSIVLCVSLLTLLAACHVIVVGEAAPGTRVGPPRPAPTGEPDGEPDDSRSAGTGLRFQSPHYLRVYLRARALDPFEDPASR